MQCLPKVILLREVFLKEVFMNARASEYQVEADSGTHSTQFKFVPVVNRDKYPNLRS